MIFFKSILAGLGALVLGTLFAIAVLFGWPLWRTAVDSKDGVGFDVVGAHMRPILGIGLGIFAAGLCWQWRRGPETYTATLSLIASLGA
jgi:hypothetical protein